MTFNINGKVALISGGASGIGLQYAKELIRNKIRGVTLADINNQFGENALKEIENEFGLNKAIFVKTDVTDIHSYEEAFKKTVEVFKNIDIVINNAGILNDAAWEKEIAININGSIHGVLLGLENYIPKYKTDSHGVIVNISSTAGLDAAASHPIYSATKFAVIGFSKAFGKQIHYDRTKVKVLTLCPGVTDTSMINEMSGKNLGVPYQDIIEKTSTLLEKQKPENVAFAMIYIIKYAKTGTVWVVEGGEKPYEYLHSPREKFKTVECCTKRVDITCTTMDG